MLRHIARFLQVACLFFSAPQTELNNLATHSTSFILRGMYILYAYYSELFGEREKYMFPVIQEQTDWYEIRGRKENERIDETFIVILKRAPDTFCTKRAFALSTVF